MTNNKTIYDIFGIRVINSSSEQKFWTKIGTGFQNKDGSINLVFHYRPEDGSNTQLQLRIREEKKGE